MLQIRLFAQKWYINVSLCALLLFFTVSCESNEAVEPGRELSGEEIFKGIFFAHGDFAKSLSSQKEQLQNFESLSAEQKLEVETKLNELTEFIRKKHPSFFDDFKADLTTKDHHRIKAAIEGASEVLYEGLAATFPEIKAISEQVKADVEKGLIITDGELDMKKLEDRKPEYEKLLSNNIISGNGRANACSLAIVCVVYFAVAAHHTAAVTAAAAVVIVAALWIAYATSEKSTAKQDDPLSFEIMVNEIATAL